MGIGIILIWFLEIYKLSIKKDKNKIYMLINKILMILLIIKKLNILTVNTMIPNPEIHKIIISLIKPILICDSLYHFHILNNNHSNLTNQT